jgi:hypothetical protein
MRLRPLERAAPRYTPGRDVALQVLPLELAHDPVRRQRFEQESRAVAALTFWIYRWKVAPVQDPADA